MLNLFQHLLDVGFMKSRIHEIARSNITILGFIYVFFNCFYWTCAMLNMFDFGSQNTMEFTDEVCQFGLSFDNALQGWIILIIYGINALIGFSLSRRLKNRFLKISSFAFGVETIIVGVILILLILFKLYD